MTRVGQSRASENISRITLPRLLDKVVLISKTVDKALICGGNLAGFFSGTINFSIVLL